MGEESIELPPLDAGSRPEGEMPPLDAGDESKPKPEVRYVERKQEKSESAPTPEVSDESEAEPESESEDDDEILNLIAGGSKAEESETPATEKLPDGVSEEEWKAYQAYKQSQQANLQQASEPEPPVPVNLEITSEDFDAAFENVDGFKSILNKATTASNVRLKQELYGNLQQAFETFGNNVTSTIEQMIYLHEAVKEAPEIYNYPDAFRVAYAKAFKSAPKGDLRTPVTKAVETMRREMARAERIGKTKKVDVRGEQKAPKGPKVTGRNANKTKGASDDDGLGFLAAIHGGAR